MACGLPLIILHVVQLSSGPRHPTLKLALLIHSGISRAGFSRPPRPALGPPIPVPISLSGPCTVVQKWAVVSVLALPSSPVMVDAWRL